MGSMGRLGDCGQLCRGLKCLFSTSVPDAFDFAHEVASFHLFEAAACGSAIISDYRPGLETFFGPEEEFLVAETTEQVKAYLN